VMEIRRATSGDVDACTEVLAQAFQDDPGTINFEPDPERRKVVLPAFFRTFVAASLADDADLELAGEPVEGVASWFGPERHGPSPDAMGANGFGDVLGLCGPESSQRLLDMIGELERQHAQLINEPHLRLEFYGVAPHRQGMGIGSDLIKHGHDRADALGLATYLDTFTEQNVRFYERRGYSVAGTFTVGKGTRGYGMVRQPGAG
jgi:ribosomal protein S18 acetylase RimI-like enzyme